MAALTDAVVAASEEIVVLVDPPLLELPPLELLPLLV
jgi:hypothetical protein